jgi:3-deoxy-7-phosphoheptulonate synthase/chorismate mutase
MAENLEELRKQIDDIDVEIVKQMNQRAGVVLQIRGHKKHEGMPMHDPERELRVLNKVMAANDGPLDDETIRHLYRHIMQHMREFKADE